MKVRDLPNDCGHRSTHTVSSKKLTRKKQIISPSSLNHTQSIKQTTSNPASALWANSRDYRIKHKK
mgnify:FL=1